MGFWRRRESGPSADAVWNRAASGDPLPGDARVGDRALRDALEVHGYVMNGGLDHGLDVAGAAGVERAAASWEYLGRRDVAELLRAALRVVADMPDDPQARAEFLMGGWTEEQAEAIEALDGR